MPRTGMPPSRAAAAVLSREETIRALRNALGLSPHDQAPGVPREVLTSALSHLQVGLGSGRSFTIPAAVVQAIRELDRGQSTRELRAEVAYRFPGLPAPSAAHVYRIRMGMSRADVPDTPALAREG
jgi:hypothetical protein